MGSLKNSQIRSGTADIGLSTLQRTNEHPKAVNIRGAVFKANIYRLAHHEGALPAVGASGVFIIGVDFKESCSVENLIFQLRGDAGMAPE